MWEFKKIKAQEFVPLMRFFVDLYQPDVYVEIGIQDGVTFNQISPFVKEAYAVDILPMSLVKRTENVIICQSPSLEFAKQWDKSKRIDLLFIDADHNKNKVLADFEAWSPYVTPGTGLILLHDTYPSAPYLLKKGWCSSAWEAASLLHRSKEYGNWEIVTLPGPYSGISILRNVEQGHLHWMKD